MEGLAVPFGGDLKEGDNVVVTGKGDRFHSKRADPIPGLVSLASASITASRPRYVPLMALFPARCSGKKWVFSRNALF